MGRPDEPYHVTLEVVNKQCKGLEMLKELGVQQCTLVDVRSMPNGLTRHLVKFSSEQLKKVPSSKYVRILRGKKPDSKSSAWFDIEGCDLCKTVLSSGSFLISGKNVEDYTIIYSFVTPSFIAYQKILSTLESHGLKPKVLEIGKFTPKGKVLTEKQERVLWLALKMGFFDFPRKISMKDLAHRLGVGLSTLSEITRRGTRRLLENHFKT